MRHATRCLLGAALVSIVAPAGVRADPPTAAFIPVIINIYKNAGITEAQAKDAIKEANKIYSRLKVGITLVPVKTNNNVTDGDAEEDGKVDWANREYDKWNEHGKKEIEKTDNKKGIKLSFGLEPEKGKTNPGWAFHGQPMACVKNRGTKELTGATIAHEVGHIMTLKDHVVDDRKNLMAPSEEGNGGAAFRETDPSKLTLTQAQIDEIRKSRFTRGKCSTQFQQAYPAEKNPQQWAAKTDNSGDSTGAFAYSDLSSLTLSSLNDGTSSLEGVLTLQSKFSGTVNNVYSLAINSDNAPSGFPYKGFTGVEYAVEVLVTGSGGSYVANGLIRNLGTGSIIPMMQQPLIDDSTMVGDTDDPSSVGVPMEQLLFNVDKNLVGMSSIGAHFAPIGVIAEEGSSIVDTDSTEFNLQRWLDDPTLMTSGTGVPTPGMPYAFTIDNLNPNDTFNVFLNDSLVASGLLDAGGDGGGSFIWPMDVPVDANFLYAQDSTGEFAYSVTCPEPSSAIALVALLPVIRRRRHG
jgi:hypothetical protein